MCAPETLPPSKASYYCLDLAGLDDKLYKFSVPADKWLDQATTADKNGFAAGSLGKVSPCSFNVQLERCFGIHDPLRALVRMSSFVHSFIFLPSF